MTKFKHDEFAKDLLRTILEPYGRVQIDRPITNELRRIDVFFTPAEVAPDDAVCTGIIVVHHLPKTPETVWFRTLGRGKVQQEAIDEIAALPKGSVYRQKVLELFVSLKVNLENSTDRDPDEMELLMSLAESPVFVEYMERATADAVTKALETRDQDFVESLILKRFGSMDIELMAVVPNIIKLLPAEFTPLLMDLSREELIDRFTDQTAD
jgi:hypothetical protein